VKIVAHRDRCMGHSQCLIAAPEVFDLDDEGLVVILQEDPSDELRPAVREAILRCPEQALEAAD
jgi:ferredoxin